MSNNYRSKFEQLVCEALPCKFKYEPWPIHFTYPAKTARYLPDVLLPNGVIVEIKGRFTNADRKKHKAIKNSTGGKYDIRFLFQCDNTIYKGSKTRYSDWSKKHGFQYHVGKTIPEEWINVKC